jgi:hypothetical protein
MNNAWDKAKSLADKHATQGSIFVRLQNDGDAVVGVFCGEPYAREVYWDGEKYVEATADGPPPGATAKTPSLRVALNFYVPSEGTMKIVEGGTQWFRDLVNVREKYGLDKWLFEIKRHGKPKDPKTKYTILPEEKIDDALRAKLAHVAAHDLAQMSAPSEDGDASGGAGPRLIDVDVARQFADRLRALPRSDADAFLQEFKIERLRDLPNDRVPAALQLLMRLEASHKTASAAKDAAVDPFAV